jgi:ferrous iron transport protein A
MWPAWLLEPETLGLTQINCERFALRIHLGTSWINMHDPAMNLPATFCLADLPNGTHATVAGLRAGSAEADDALLRRLAEIGFVAGEPVRLLRRGPGGREPLAVQVGDTLFALRSLEARCIEVELGHV